MKKSFLVCLAVGFLLFGVVGAASATLVGDSVTSQHYFPDLSSPYGNLEVAIVTADSSDIMEPIYGSYYNVDVNADSFFVDFFSNNTWSSASFNGVFVDSLNDSSGNDLQSVGIETNMVGWDNARLTFDADSVWLNWNSLGFNTDTYFNVSLDFGAAPVPEPSTMILLGFGILGLAGITRRKMKK